MEAKAKALFVELQRIFRNGHIEYRFENELHKYRLERDGPFQWLYVSRNFVDDNTEKYLLDSLSRWRIPEAFRSSTQNRWLFLSEAGVQEVDDGFGRGR